MKPIRTLALAAAVSALATGAYASTFTATLDTLSGLGTVNVTNVPTGSGVSTGVKNAAAFNMSSTDAAAPSSLTSFVAWCLDLAATVATGGEYRYTVTEDPFGNSFGLSPVQENRVQRLFDRHYADIKADYNNQLNVVAFQLALWEAVYEADANTPSVSADLFRAVDAGVAGAAARANTFLDQAMAYTGSQQWILTFLQSDPLQGQARSQNLVTATVIPLPATGFMMLSVMGLGGIGVMVRRRRDKAA